MTDAIRDENHVTAKLGVLFSDGVTLVPIKIDSVTGGLMTNTTDTISQDVINVAPRDNNWDAVWMGTNSVTGETIPIYVDADGAILIDN